MVLDEWIIMPNHIHGIIVIGGGTGFQDFGHQWKNRPGLVARTDENAPRRVPTGIQPLVKNSLSSIVNHLKGNVKKWCNKNGFGYFSWQERFYDHIIREDIALNNIRDYIQDNPVNWERDRNNLGNLYM